MKPDDERHRLYQEAVQDVETEIDFIEETFRKIRSRPARDLREDFCGTAQTACEWVRRDKKNRAWAVDLDPEVLAWGKQHNVGQLSTEQTRRIELLQADVLEVKTPPLDAALAMNFSYWLFTDRQQLGEYFAAVRQSLKRDGVLFLDAYGGSDAPMEIVEERDCEGFTYIWEQASFDPITNLMDCHIHFKIEDGTRLDQAFSYQWRLWSLPEIRELLAEAGFARSTVYWEGTDPESGEGDGIYSPAETATQDPGWICYLTAEK